MNSKRSNLTRILGSVSGKSLRHWSLVILREDHIRFGSPVNLISSTPNRSFKSIFERIKFVIIRMFDSNSKISV